jgi:hypothetical protein
LHGRACIGQRRDLGCLFLGYPAGHRPLHRFAWRRKARWRRKVALDGRAFVLFTHVEHEFVKPRHVRVGARGEQRVVFLQAKQQPVEEGEAQRIAVEDGDLPELEEALGHDTDRAAGHAPLFGGGRKEVVVAHLPAHLVRRRAGHQERPRGGAPLVEIVLASEPYQLHSFTICSRQRFAQAASKKSPARGPGSVWDCG